MKKKSDYIIGFVLLAFALTAICTSGQCEEYIVPNFIGGINVGTDSTDLAPNQSLVLKNLTFDMPNVATNRKGYSYWNDSLISDNEIQTNFIYKPYADTQRLVFVCNGYIYINAGLDDPGTVDWDTLRFSVSGDSLRVVNGQNFATDVDDDLFFQLFVGNGDRLIDANGEDTQIERSALTYSNIIFFTDNYGGSTDTVTYEIVKRISGNPYFAQYQNRLYVNDSENFPFVYNDTSMIYLAVVDTGTVTDTVNVGDSTLIYNTGDVHVAGKYVYGRGDSLLFETGGVQPGDVFIMYFQQEGRGDRDGGGLRIADIRFAAIVADTLSEKRLELDRVMPYTPINYWNDYEIRREYFSCVLTDTAQAVIDTGKSWWDTQYGDVYLQNFYAISSHYGVYSNFVIQCNSDTTFTCEQTRPELVGYMRPDDQYAIFSRIPYDTDTSFLDQYIEYPRFSKMQFYNNQLFAFGFDQITEDEWSGCCEQAKNLKANIQRIWYSEILMPYFMRYNYNFDVTSNSGITNLFELRDGLYISDEIGIWRFSGRPYLFGVLSEGITTKTATNNGIPDLDNWAKATEEYGYFTNRTGIYRFDGVRPEKISYLIDPIIEGNYNSRIVMVYQNPILYVSFTDSNFTLAFDERYEYYDHGQLVIPSTELNFGMTCAYAPPDTNIIYFGLHGQNGRVYYYPNGECWDRNSPTDSSAIPIEYKSGWQAFGGYWINKQLQKGYFPMLSPDTANIYIYKNFVTTPADSLIVDSTGRFVYSKKITNMTAEYIQTQIIDTVSSQIIIGGYRYTWQELPEFPK